MLLMAVVSSDRDFQLSACRLRDVAPVHHWVERRDHQQRQDPRRHHPSDHRDGDALHDLRAGLYEARGLNPIAEQLDQQTFAIFEKSLGTAHPTTQAIRNNIDRVRPGFLSRLFGRK